MTYESRLPANYSFGTLTTAAAISDTTLVSADFATQIPSGLSTTLYVPITLQDPSTKTFEIVWANAHSSSSTSVTVLRGREGTTPRSWGSGTLWVVAPTLRDGMLPVSTRSALPTDPHVGMRAYIEDEQVAVSWVLGAGWLSQSGMSYRANQTLVADAATVTFSGIPSTLKKLEVAYSGRCTGSTTLRQLLMRINGDSSAAYYSTFHTQEDLTITSFTETAIGYHTVGFLGAASAAPANWGAGTIQIPGWNQPASRPAVNHQWHSNFFDVNAFLSLGGGEYTAAGPYTSLVFYASAGNITAGSEFTIYGWG